MALGGTKASVSPRALTDKQVLEIYRRVHAGERGIALAREFGVTQCAVSSIKNGRKWRLITGHRPTDPTPRRPKTIINAVMTEPALTLEQMLAHNPAALELLKLAEQRRAERKDAERARAAEMIERMERVDEARAKRKAQLGRARLAR